MDGPQPIKLPTHGFSVNRFRNLTPPKVTQQNELRRIRTPVGLLGDGR